jgi:hypothetical protein
MIGFVEEYALGKALDYATRKAIGVVGRQRLVLHFNRFLPHAAGTLAEKYLQKDATTELIEFYENVLPVSITLGGKEIQLPFELVLAPFPVGSFVEQPISICFTDQAYKPPPSIDVYTSSVKAEARGRGLYDGNVVRLRKLENNSGGATIYVETAKYFDSLATNFAMDHKPTGRLQSLRDHLHGPIKAFNAFHDDVLVNHIGLVCMIETADGQLVVQIRSRDVANRPWTRSSSVSGVLDLFDLKSIGSHKKIALKDVALGICREAFEEIGVLIEDAHFLGLFREMLRGGKPELYFFARSRESFSEIVEARRYAQDKGESINLEGFDFRSQNNAPNRVSAKDFISAFDQRVLGILSAVEKTANMTLIAGTVLAAAYIHRTNLLP